MGFGAQHDIWLVEINNAARINCIFHKWQIVESPQEDVQQCLISKENQNDSANNI